MEVQVLILGAGLSGISASFHIGHAKCLILEKDYRPFGHIAVMQHDGYTWDPGPHVSFTKNEYVRELFADSVDGQFDEYGVKVGNYFNGLWIDHPAQTSLYQLPEPLRSECLESFHEARSNDNEAVTNSPNYLAWLERAFGRVFAHTFPAAYTRKYWTRDPKDLTTDWLGNRVFYPSKDDVVAGSHAPLNRPTHYITRVRYPKRGGYQSFAKSLAANSRIQFGAEVISIDLVNRIVKTSDGRTFHYEKLINTLPLPAFIASCKGTPEEVQKAAMELSCSQLLLVNVMAKHPTVRSENWIYVYDEDKFATRIHCTELLTPGNAPTNSTGIQVEVYFSRHRPLHLPPIEIGQKVEAELMEMGLIEPQRNRESTRLSHSIRYSPWANVIFDHQTRPNMDVIWGWLEEFGLQREKDDLHPTTNWQENPGVDFSKSRLIFAGRFGQWKYFWTDDCVLRGKQLGANHVG